MTSDSNGHVTTRDENNPFLADGELSRKADFIIQHSRISRTEIHIADPDSPQSARQDEVTNTTLLNPVVAQQTTSEPSGLKSGGLEVEVGRGSGVKDQQPQKAEQVKLSNKKKMCCTIL